jgi:hypothetical protein
MSRVATFAKELLRRKVVRVVGAYLGIFWALVLGVASLLEPLDVPNFVFYALLIVGAAGTPLAAFLAWKYDIVPPQLVRDLKDLEAENPGLSWARVRHDTKDAGYVLLSWAGPDGRAREKRYFQPVSVGRDPTNDIELSDDRVSRHHAVLWADEGVWHVRDLKSANGTFIGGDRVTESSPVPTTCDLRFHLNGPVVSVRVVKSAATRIG